MRRRSSSSRQRSHVFLGEPAEAPAGVEKGDPGQRIKKKKTLSHPAVRKVYAFCCKPLPYNYVSEEDAVPGSRITARYSRWAGPTATVWDFISFFFSFLSCAITWRGGSRRLRGGHGTFPIQS